MSGQADTAPVSMDEVAAFLVDNPEADQQDELPNDDLGPDDESDNPDGENPDGGDADGDSPDDEADGDPDKDTADASENAKGQPSGLKFKVPVKGEDGSDTTIEVDEKELIAGYQRHADYTRKTQELGNREREAHELVSRKLVEGRDHYMRETQKAHAAIQMLAGLKTDAEMAQLAATDQNAWVQEKARAEAIKGVLAQLDQSMDLEQQQVQQQNQVAQQQEFHRAWGVLGQEGIDKPKLQAIYQGIAKTYGVDEQRFATVTDPKVVLIMRDALSFRQLKAQAAATKQKVQAAPKLPAARQAVPRSEQVNKRLDQRFRSGKAGTRDLAAFISNNSK